MQATKILRHKRVKETKVDKMRKHINLDVKQSKR